MYVEHDYPSVWLIGIFKQMLAKIIILQDFKMRLINSSEIPKPRIIYKYQYLHTWKWNIRLSPLYFMAKIT